MFKDISVSKRRLAQLGLASMLLLWPQCDLWAQDEIPPGEASPVENTGSRSDQASEKFQKLETVDEETLEAFRSYKRAAERYKTEINTYRLDLRRTLMSDYQTRLSSVDATYAKKISKLREEEAAMRESVIERMEAFLRRYGDDHEKSADILYRLARLHYERADDAYLAIDDGSMEHPDFTVALGYLATLQQNFPNFDQMDGALYLKGYCLSQMGRNEEARDTFLTLNAAYPDSPRRAEVLTRIGEYYFNQSQDAILGLGGEIMWDEALKYYTEAVSIGQDTSVYDRALYRKAWTEYYTEDYDGMIKDFIALVGYADNVANGSALRSEAIDFMAAALAEEDWDLSDNVAIDPDYGMARFNKYLNTGAPFESEVLRKFADTLMEQTRYEYAADAYENYINRGSCSPDLPEVIRIYVAALTMAGKVEKAANEQARIESLVGVGSEWYLCQEREGNLEAIAAAALASQQAMKNSIMTFHDRVTRAEDKVTEAKEFIEDNPKLKGAARTQAEKNLTDAEKNLVQANRELADLTAEFVNNYPNDEEIYNYRYLLGQAYFYSEQYSKSIEAFTSIRDIENSRYQADAARYIADAYEFLIFDKARKYPEYVYALPLNELAERTNTGKMRLKDTPMSILLSGAITTYTKEEIDKEIADRKGGTVKREMPEDVRELVDAREFFSEVERKSGKTDDDPTSLASIYLYDNAMIFYNYGDFEEAEKRFMEVIEKTPSSQHAASAADIILSEYESRGDLDKVASLSDQFATMQLGTGSSSGSDDIVNSRFKDKKYNALFQKAFKLFDDKQYLEAAAEFIKIIDENPTFEHNNRALYNAAYAYEQMKYYDSAMQMYRRVISEYGESEEAVNALYRIGVNAEKFFDFDTAVESFLSLYNNKKPLYKNFKYRVNALRNAARIKILIEDKKGAAQLLERYHADYPGQSDAPQFLYEAGRSYAELGQFSDAQRIFKEFRKKYSTDSKVRAYIVASYVVEGDYYRKKNRTKDARASYETARSLYQAAPTAAGAIGRDNAAKAAFYLADFEYQDWANVKIKGKMKEMISKLKDHMAEMKRIYNEFSLVMNYNSPIWGIASRYAIARMMHELVTELDTVPCPSDIKKGSDNHLAFLASMSDMATGTRDEAIKMYQNAINASKMAGISIEWTKKSLDGLKQLDRTASNQERLDPHHDVYGSNPLVTPYEFQTREAEKAAAKAEAAAEAEAEASKQ